MMEGEYRGRAEAQKTSALNTGPCWQSVWDGLRPPDRSFTKRKGLSPRF